MTPGIDGINFERELGALEIAVQVALAMFLGFQMRRGIHTQNTHVVYIPALRYYMHV